MSTERESSPSFRSRQILCKVSHTSKQLPGDFFLPKPLSSPPKKRQSQPPPSAALQKWYERDESEEKNQSKRMPQRGKQSSRIRLMNQNQSPQSPVKLSERQGYLHHLFQSIQKKQSIVYQTLKGPKEKAPREERQSRRIQRMPTGHQLKRKESKPRVIKSESKHRSKKIFQTPQKQKGQKVKQIRLSLKELPRSRGSSQGRYENVNVGFDGMLTFNRFR